MCVSMCVNVHEYVCKRTPIYKYKYTHQYTHCLSLSLTQKIGCAEGELPPAPGTFAQPGDCAGLPAQVAPGCVVDHGKGVMDGQALQQ